MKAFHHFSHPPQVLPLPHPWSPAKPPLPPPGGRGLLPGDVLPRRLPLPRPGLGRPRSGGRSAPTALNGPPVARPPSCLPDPHLYRPLASQPSAVGSLGHSPLSPQSSPPRLRISSPGVCPKKYSNPQGIFEPLRNPYCPNSFIRAAPSPKGVFFLRFSCFVLRNKHKPYNNVAAVAGKCILHCGVWKKKSPTKGKSH